jgi:hypothetical protein
MVATKPAQPFDGTCQNPDCAKDVPKGKGHRIYDVVKDRQELKVCEDCAASGTFGDFSILLPVEW